MSLLIDHQTLGADVVEQSARLPQETPPKPPKLRPSRPLSSLVKVSTLSGLGFFVVLFAAEHAAPSPWKPSTVIGAFGGNEKSAQMLASLEADRALVAMQEQEKGRALQETEILRANQERLTRAYQAEYDRGTELIKAGAAAAQTLLQNVTKARLDGLTGKAENANMADRAGMFCSLIEMLSGNSVCSEQAHTYAAGQRGDAQAEIIGSWKRANAELSHIALTWAEGLPDPLQLIQQAARQGGPTFTVPPRSPTPPRPDRAPSQES